MGFCSGTEIFDPVVAHILDAQLPETQATALIGALIEALWDHDWDCESDSAYWDHPLVRQVFRNLQPDWFEEG